MNWDRAILTDSGGYQVFSLSSMNKVTEEGVTFQSHLDGSRHLISPEKSMEIQKALGSDIVMNFDECPALPATKERLRESMELTLRWAKRCRDFRLKDHQNLFGIIQGGLHFDLRLECMQRLQELNFEGYALGGLSVGEKNEEMVDFLDQFVHQMPEDKPVHQPSPNTRPRLQSVTTVHQHQRRLVIRYLRPHRSDDRNVVRMRLSRPLKQIADLQPAPPVS